MFHRVQAGRIEAIATRRVADAGSTGIEAGVARSPSRGRTKAASSCASYNGAHVSTVQVPI